MKCENVYESSETFVQLPDDEEIPEAILVYDEIIKASAEREISKIKQEIYRLLTGKIKICVIENISDSRIS